MKCSCVIFLLLYSILTTAGQFVVEGPDRPVDAVAGEDALLPCFLKPSVSAVDKEVMWLIGSAVVHRYRHHRDEVDLQLQDYRGRTSLSREELQRGNVSLKLTSVQFSDTNTYRCYIVTPEGGLETDIELTVEAVGSTPNISTESLGNGSVRLQCGSKGWSPEPRVEWLGSSGQILAAEPTEVQRRPEGFSLTRSITVQEHDGSRFSCRVSNSKQIQVQETDVPRIRFSRPRHRWYRCGVFLVFVVVLVGLFIVKKIRDEGLNQYKEWVMSSVGSLPELSPFPGNLHDYYTIPHIIRRCQEEDKVLASGGIFQKIYCNIGIDQLFSPDGGGANVIILQGHSGYGKTFTVRKIMCDWASGEDYLSQFALVLLLKCDELRQELDQQGQPERSLVELISTKATFQPLAERILKESPHKVLFIVDGFDELRLPTEEPRSTLPSQPFFRAPPEVMLRALLAGHVLAESLLLVTTRCTASDRLSQVLRRRKWQLTEILGFTDNLGCSGGTVQKYVQRFFSDDRQAEEAYQHVLKNDFLLSSCLVPLMGWMTCSVLRDTPSDDTTITTLQTKTSMFLRFCFWHVRRHNILRDLCKMAESGVLTRYQGSVYDMIADPTKPPLLHQSVLGSDDSQKVMFTHQTIQEFFIALHYVVNEAEAEAVTKVKRLLSSVHRDSGEEVAHLQPVIKFLFGLSNANMWRLVLDKFKLGHSAAGNMPPPTSPVRNWLEEWILEEVEKFVLKDVGMLFLHCLFELHEEQFVKTAMKKWRKIDFASVALKRMDCWALRYCLQCQPDIARLNLSSCNLTATELKLLAPALASLKCEDLWLDVEGLSDADIGVLVSALGTGRNLRRLRVEHSSLSDESVQQVLRALGRQTSVCSVHLSVKTVSLSTADLLLRHLHQTTVTGIMSVRVIGEVPSAGDCLGSSLYAEKDQHSFTVCVERNGTDPRPALSRLSVTLLSDTPGAANWRGFFTSFQNLRELKERPEMEKDVLDLFSTLKSLPSLEKMHLKARIQSIEWASIILTFIHDCSSLQDIDVRVREELKSRDTLCSYLSVRKHQPGSLRLTVGLHVLESVLREPKWRRPRPCSLSEQKNRLSPLSLVSFAVPDANVPSAGWEHFLLLFHNLSRGTGSSADADALFSTLGSMSGLREVELRLEALTEAWAQRVLTFLRTQPNEDISVHVLEEWGGHKEGLCSTFFIRKTASTFRLTVEHLSEDISSRPTHTASAVSFISVLADTHTHTHAQTDAHTHTHTHTHCPGIDWLAYLRQFHTLKHGIESQYLDEHVGPVLFQLRCVSGLREVELRVSSLTEVWARRILSLIHNCPSLQEVRLSAGHVEVHCGLSAWIECGPLLVQHLTHLKDSPKRHDCIITLTGIKRRNIEVSSHFREGRLYHNRPVKKCLHYGCS